MSYYDTVTMLGYRDLLRGHLLYSEKRSRILERGNPEASSYNTMVNVLPFHKLDMAGRVRFLDGDSEIYPGLSILGWGGHTNYLYYPNSINGILR